MLSNGLTDGEENERPPILPPDLAASASPGAEKATAATVAATVANLAMSVVRASHGLLLLSPPPAAAMRKGTEVVADRCCARVSPAVVPAKRAEGAGTNEEAGMTHKRPNTAAADLMFVFLSFVLLKVLVRREFERATDTRMCQEK